MAAFDEEGMDAFDDEALDEGFWPFDTLCAICDNGGVLICCEGKCKRSFHVTHEDGLESACPTLGYNEAELEAMRNIEFHCRNCEQKLHQCFVCGTLGSSNEMAHPEVFLCGVEACGHFYHPHCVAPLLRDGDEAAAPELQTRIVNGDQFECPLHRCHVCKETEDQSDPTLQFAICRRCPKAYHRNCLPIEIAFEPRAWEGLLPNHIAIYCMEHDIDEDLGTPLRNHIRFPEPQCIIDVGSYDVASEDDD